MQQDGLASNELLVRAARSGDREAFGLLVERYQDLVCALAYSRIGILEAAQDIAQEAFLASFEGLRSLRSPSKYGPWLAHITRKLCGRWHRSERYRQALVERLREFARFDRTATPAEVLESRETQTTLHEAIERLPVRVRELLILYYFRGCSALECAKALGISHGTVHARLARARQNIRDYMTREVEKGLEKARPREDFAKRILAVLPSGSVCAKLGFKVAGSPLLGTLGKALGALAHKASLVVTGGGAAVTTKTTVLIASGALAIAVAGGMGYRQIRHALLARTYQTRAATARAEAGKVSALPPSSPAQVDTGEPSASTSGILPVSASKLSTRPSKPATLLPTATARELYELILHGYPELGRGARDRMIARQVRDAFIARGSPEGEMKLWLELIKEMRLDGRWETSPELLPLWLGLYQMLVDSRSWRSQTTDLSLFMLLDDEAHAGTRNAIVGFGALLHRLLLAYAGQGRAEDARRWLGEAIAEIEALLSQVPAGEEDAETVRRKLRRAQTLLGGYSEKLDVLWERSVRALEEGERSREERLSRIQELETSLQAGAFETAPEEAKALIELGQWYYNMEEYERAIQCCEKAAQKAPAMSRDLSVWIRDTRKLAEIQSWTAEEQMQLARSEYNLRQIGSAMSGYAGSHVCNLPSSLEELVDHGYIADPEVLVDPLSGERFEWMSGLSANSAGPQIVARGAGKNGVVVVLEVDLSAAAAPSDTRFGLPFNVDTKFEQPFEKAAQEDADAGVSLGPIGESLKAIGLAIHMYAADYEERLPVSLEALVKEGYITDPKTIIDPASGKPYQYTSGLAANAHLNVPVITATEGSETYTLYVDGHVTRTEQ